MKFPLMVSNKLYAALKVSLKLYDLNEYNEYEFWITFFHQEENNKYLMWKTWENTTACNFLRGVWFDELFSADWSSYYSTFILVSFIHRALIKLSLMLHEYAILAHKGCWNYSNDSCFLLIKLVTPVLLGIIIFICLYMFL